MRDVAGRSLPSDRGAVARTTHDLVLAVVQQHTPAGTSVVVEGAPGIGKTHLALEILDAIPPGAAKILRGAGQRGRRNDPFAVAVQLLGGTAPAGNPAEEAFDLIDQLCADGPVVLWVDDAHNLDAGSLTLLRRLVWASRSLPLAVLVTTRPSPSREQLTTLVRQAQERLMLPPMGPMLVERVVFGRTGRWPGPELRRILGMAAGNPLFVGELLGAYEKAGALADAGPDSIEAAFELDLQATGLDEVIRAQVRQLDEPILQLLAVMAVWGTDIGADDLAAMLPGPAGVTDPRDSTGSLGVAGSLGRLIERAISSGLVRQEAAGTVGFAHDLFREVIYAGLPERQRREIHQRAAQVLAAAGYRPTLVADHLLRAASDDPDPALVTALQEAVAATRGYAPEVTADLLDDVAAVSGSDVPEPLLLDHAQALFLRGRSESAETLIRQRIAAITDPAVALQMQVIMIRSLMNRADVAAALAAIDQTAGITGLPAAALHQLETTRAWLLALAGQIQPAAELDAMMARFVSVGDQSAQASALAVCATAAFLSGRPDAALEYLQAREGIRLDPDAFRYRSSMLVLPALFELARSGPVAAKVIIDRTRRLTAERSAEWVDPLLGFAAGGIAFVAGDWDGAVAELDAALERAEETNSGWISHPVGMRSYIDAHRGDTGRARARLESFRHRGLPLQFGQDRPGLAELAVLEAEGSIREAATLARSLWSAASSRPDRWAGDIAADVTRVALAGMDRRLADQVGGDAAALCSPGTARLVRGMIAADPDALDQAAADLAGSGRHAAEAFAREELAATAAATGDRGRAVEALDAALDGYQRMAAVPDRNRLLGRMRALGIRRGSRAAHREAAHGWASLTATEVRIAELVRDGLTNREIGTRMFVSPRTVQTHVSHILQKTGLRSRVEIARFAEA
jgi:DNA-binding CsgD family transcriptional regulator